MKRHRLICLVQLAAWTASTTAQSLVYVTDLTIFSSLAPCAASAVSEVVQDLTESQCPAAVTALESCACTQDQNSAGVQKSIASSVSGACGSTATEDITSAAAVFSVYCNQAAPQTAPTPTLLVSQYITDLGAYSSLAPCAQSAVSYVVLGLTENDCPSAQPQLASCACSKNQNSLAVSASINSNVRDNCGSTHAADVTSAEAVFAGYCGMNTGNTSFPTATPLPGSLTYYITDLPAYASLAPCAQSAVSYAVQSQSFCPSDPNALVSCACVKDMNSAGISSTLVSSVSDECGSTASADVTSALGVFAFYCSAGKGLVAATGVTGSAPAITFADLPGQTGAPGTGRIPRPTPVQTGTAGGYNSSGGGGGGSSSPDTSKASKPVPIGAIVGGAGGGIALVIAGLVAWFCLSRRNKRNAPASPAAVTSPEVKDSNGSVELHPYTKMSASPPLKAQDPPYGVPAPQYASEMPGSNAAVAPYPSKKAELSSPGGYPNAYPANKSELTTSPGGYSTHTYPANASELSTPVSAPTPQPQYAQPYPPYPPQELYGRPPTQELYGQQPPPVPPLPQQPPQFRNQGPGMGYQSGPIYEMYTPGAPPPPPSSAPAPNRF